LIKDGRMDQEARRNKNQEFEHILLCVGEGSIKSEEVRRWFYDDSDTFSKDSSSESYNMVEKILPSKKMVMKTSHSDNEILVDGMKNVMTRIARCCSPLRDQPIRGYLTKEKIISIHNEKCPFLLKLNPDRIIKVNWSNNVR